MTRMETGAKYEIKTFEYVPFYHTDIMIEENDSFCDKINKNSFRETMACVINEYTGEDYKILNDYLRTGKISGNKYTEDELKSWTFWLHTALEKRRLNVWDGTVVYRGINSKPPSYWKIGYKFIFAEFVSTSLNKKNAENFSQGGTLLIITLYNIESRYCNYIADISKFPYEEEVLITSCCHFEITNIVGNKYYLDCDGFYKEDDRRNFKRFLTAAFVEK